MRTWLGAALLTVTVAAAVAGCARGGAPVDGRAETEASVAASPAERDVVCTAFASHLRRSLDDPTQPAVRDYDIMRRNPDRFSADQRVRIRQAYFDHQAEGMRSVAAQTTDGPLRDAIGRVADGLMRQGADISATDVPPALPALVEVETLCGARIVGVPQPARS